MFLRLLSAVSRIRRTDRTLNENRSISELSTCKDFVAVSEIKLEHQCVVLKVAELLSYA